MVKFDFTIGGIGSFGVMILIAMMFICYCFAIHLIVTWNPHHRPAIPLTASLILSIGPMFALSMEGDGTSSVGEMLEIAFLITSLGAGIIVLWMPVILALVRMQMLRVSRMRPSDDPLIEMLEN